MGVVRKRMWAWFIYLTPYPLPSAFMLYYDNPKGMIPTWLINWGAQVGVAMGGAKGAFIHTHTHIQTGVPQFLDMMRKAVFGYEKWLKDTGREAVKPPEVSLKINTKSS